MVSASFRLSVVPNSKEASQWIDIASCALDDGSTNLSDILDCDTNLSSIIKAFLQSDELKIKLNIESFIDGLVVEEKPMNSEEIQTKFYTLPDNVKSYFYKRLGEETCNYIDVSMSAKSILCGFEVTDFLKCPDFDEKLSKFIDDFIKYEFTEESLGTTPEGLSSDEYRVNKLYEFFDIVLKNQRAVKYFEDKMSGVDLESPMTDIAAYQAYQRYQGNEVPEAEVEEKAGTKPSQGEAGPI